jgi:hypothetical protein
MTPEEIAVLQPLITQAGEQLSCNGCNDYDISEAMPDPVMRRDMLRDAHRLNGDLDEYLRYESQNNEVVTDWFMLWYLFKKLLGEVPVTGAREPMTHELKTWPDAFDAVYTGRKRYEVRVMDRDFCVGDRLHLREWDPDQKYFGREFLAEITYMTSGGDWGLPPGLCVMSLALAAMKRDTTNPGMCIACGKSSGHHYGMNPMACGPHLWDEIQNL